MTFINSFIYILLYVLPKNIFSRFMGFLVGLKLSPQFALAVNKAFVKKFKINMQEAEKPIEEYDSLQELFTRRLKPGVRPIDSSSDYIISPCDGYVSEAGVITRGRLLQVKGKYISLSILLRSARLAERFENGHFATIYLSPRDYHRFHVPLDGHIKETKYIPGTLWPVNTWAVSNIKNLFCQNERIISLIQSEQNSKILAHIAVGACVVGKIKLAYSSLSSNKGKMTVTQENQIPVKRGQDLGLFSFGSTIVLLFEPGLIDSLLVQPHSEIRMGQPLAKLS